MNPVERILSLIAPDDCLNCGAEGSILCRECAEQIERLPSICYGCGKSSRNFRPCPKCINRWRPGHVWFYAAYQTPQAEAKGFVASLQPSAGTPQKLLLDSFCGWRKPLALDHDLRAKAKKDLPAELVKALKFEQKRFAAKAMAELINEALPYFAEQPLITYVPTAPARRRERGFDQAQLIAKELAKLRGWHVATLLKRQTKVRQLGAKRITRRRQLKDAFRAANSGMIQNSHILLVDDVVTTGATIEACTKTLLKAGANLVDCAVFAYTSKSR